MRTHIFVDFICVHIFCGVVQLSRGEIVPYTDKSYQASKKYKADHIKRIPLDVPMALYDEVKTHTAARGESVNGFIKRAISETMRRDMEGAED